MIWEGLLLLYSQRTRLVGFSTLLKFLLTDFWILCVWVVKVFFQTLAKIELTLWWSVTMKAMAIMMTAATVMKAITTMNICYSGHDSYLLEWERDISKVLINYDFFLRIWKKIWTTWRIFKSSWSKTSPMYDQLLVKTFLGWH